MTSHAQRPDRADGGFTLLELLLALVLVSGAAAMLPGAFRSAQQAVRSEADMDAARHIDEVRATLRRLLSTAMPLTVTRPDGGGIGNAFWGTDMR